MDPKTNKTPIRRGSTQVRWLLLLAAVAVVAYGLGIVQPQPRGTDWPADFAHAQAEAAASGKPLLVRFDSAACPYCIKMDRQTLSDAVVQQELAGFELVMADMQKQEQLFLAAGLEGVPAFVVLSPDNRIIARSEGFYPPDEFLTFLRQASSAVGPQT